MNTNKLKFPIAGVFFFLAIIARWLTSSSQISLYKEYPGIEAIILIFMCVWVFMKKRDMGLVIATGALLLLEILPIFSAGRVSLFYILGLLAAIVFILICVSPSLAQYQPMIQKVCFLPSVLIMISCLAQVLMYLPYSMGLFGMVSVLIRNLDNFYLAMGYLFLIKWLIQPYAKDSAMANAYCGIGKHIFFYLSTFGVWFYFWVFRMTKVLNEVLWGKEKAYDPTAQVLLIMFVPLYRLFWFYQNGKRVDACAREAGMAQTNTATLCLVWGIFLPSVASCLLQARINHVCRNLGIVEGSL